MDRTLVTVSAAELLGYDDLVSLPESTGTEKLVLKRGNLFAVTGRLGDIFPAGARDQGAYFEDTRFLSKLRLSIAGGPPVVLSTQSSAEYTSQVDLTVTSTKFGGLFNDPVNFLHLRREQLIDEHFVERLTLSNYLVRDINYWIEYEFACDFADQFEVRGARRRARGAYFLPRVEKDRVVCSYQGRDGVLYRTEIFFALRAPSSQRAWRASISISGPTRRLRWNCTPSLRCTRCDRELPCARRPTPPAARATGRRASPPKSRSRAGPIRARIPARIRRRRAASRSGWPARAPTIETGRSPPPGW